MPSWVSDVSVLMMVASGVHRGSCELPPMRRKVESYERWTRPFVRTQLL